MFGASNVMNVSGANPPLSKALDVERDYLFQLGSNLGRCAEKLVCLALQEARRMLTGASSISQGDALNQWAYFIAAMTPALDHTEIDTKVSTMFDVMNKLMCIHSMYSLNISLVPRDIQGVGCVIDGENAEISKAMAQALRQELDKMKACMNQVTQI